MASTSGWVRARHRRHKMCTSCSQQNIYNETYALYELDVPDSLSGAGINPNGTYPSYRFYHDQYSALYSWRSIGYSNYHALEAVYRQRIGRGFRPI